MATMHEGPGNHPHSTAKIGGHPIHPMLIPFPIVCFIGVLVTDIVFLNNQDPGWATASRYLLGVGIVMAALAAVAGLTDFMGSARDFIAVVNAEVWELQPGGRQVAAAPFINVSREHIVIIYPGH